MGAPAGWYKTDSDQGSLRYWDGQAWTDQVRPDPATQSDLPASADAPEASKPEGLLRRSWLWLMHRRLWARLVAFGVPAFLWGLTGSVVFFFLTARLTAWCIHGAVRRRSTGGKERSTRRRIFVGLVATLGLFPLLVVTLGPGTSVREQIDPEYGAYRAAVRQADAVRASENARAQASEEAAAAAAQASEEAEASRVQASEEAAAAAQASEEAQADRAQASEDAATALTPAPVAAPTEAPGSETTTSAPSPIRAYSPMNARCAESIRPYLTDLSNEVGGDIATLRTGIEWSEATGSGVSLVTSLAAGGMVGLDYRMQEWQELNPECVTEDYNRFRLNMRDVVLAAIDADGPGDAQAILTALEGLVPDLNDFLASAGLAPITLED